MSNNFLAKVQNPIITFKVELKMVVGFLHNFFLKVG
jgi:hypothetical protein